MLLLITVSCSPPFPLGMSGLKWQEPCGFQALKKFRCWRHMSTRALALRGWDNLSWSFKLVSWGGVGVVSSLSFIGVLYRCCWKTNWRAGTNALIRMRSNCSNRAFSSIPSYVSLMSSSFWCTPDLRKNIRICDHSHIQDVSSYIICLSIKVNIYITEITLQVLTQCRDEPVEAALHEKHPCTTNCRQLQILKLPRSEPDSIVFRLWAIKSPILNSEGQNWETKK